mgnify:CR=1 FL=1
MDSRIQYSVDYENGVVLARFNPDEIMDDLLKETMYLSNKMNNINFRWNKIFELFEKFRKDNKTSLDNLCSKAKCNMDAGDKFDLEVGKGLARRRLLVKVASLRARWFWTLEMAMMDNLFRLMDRYCHHQQIACDYDEELVNYTLSGEFCSDHEPKF